MRSRNIKPAFFKNEILAELPAETRLLFIGLWCLADREGRLEYRPKRIQAELFPYGFGSGSEAIPKHINGLSKAGFLRVYEVGGVGYLEIPNFARHQNPHKQEPPSRIPANPGGTSEPLRKDIGSRPADSLLLIPDSPLLKTKTPAPEPSALDRGMVFEKAWAMYPKKLGMKAAERHFKASVRTHKDWLDLLNAIENYKKEIRRENIEDRYIQHGSTFFNNWRDHVHYNGVEYPKPPPPKPRPVEVPPPEPTEDDLVAMHKQTVKALGHCVTKGCKFCTKMN